MRFKILISAIFFGIFFVDGSQLIDFDSLFRGSSETQRHNDGLCQRELTKFSEALAKGEFWADKLVDTWAKIPSGFFSGNQINYGDFDGCINFEHENIRGQHCMLGVVSLPNSTLDAGRSDLSLKNFANFLRKNNFVTINGFCLPASCSLENAMGFLNLQFLLRNDLVAVEGVCRPYEAPSLEPIAYFTIVLFSLIAFLMTVSTCYDVAMKHRQQDPNKLFISFSVYTNGYKLYDVTKIKGANSLNCVHGLRAMSIFWIILGHRLYNQYPWGNRNDFFALFQTTLSAAIKAHPIAVDTFFVMGALLMTWSTLKECEKGTLNIARMIWRRYIRYTPALAALILLVISFGDVLMRGPISSPELIENCRSKWWMAILHIQNFIPNTKMCFNHLWYISADFQLFVISPFIVYGLHRLGKRMLILPVFLCLATMIYIVTISFALEVRVPSPTGSADYAYWIYNPTQSRAGPWFIGIILGYFMYVHRGKTFRISRFINASMWILTISLLCTIVLLQHAFAIHHDTSIAANAFFLALQRNLWGVGICWIIFACQNLKTGGIIRWYLSLPQWQPIGRMGLSMYILGVVYQVIMILNQRVPLYLNIWQVIPTLMSDIALIIAVSTVFYLAFEAPPLIIEDYIYNKLQKPKMARNSEKIDDKA